MDEQEMKEAILILQTCQKNIKEHMKRQEEYQKENNRKIDRFFWVFVGLSLTAIAERYVLTLFK